jgi:zinc transport system substrate-binding protein
MILMIRFASRRTGPCHTPSTPSRPATDRAFRHTAASATDRAAHATAGPAAPPAHATRPAPRWRLAAAAAAALGLAATAACGTDTPAAGARPTIVAAIYPLAWVAEAVAGDDATVVSLTPSGAEPHDLELSPSQTAQLRDADLVLYLGGFQTAVDEAVAEVDPDRLLNAADYSPLMTIGEERAMAADAGTAEADLMEGDAQTLDPHFWTDPARLAAVANALGLWLDDHPPKADGHYVLAAQDLDNRLGALSQEFTEGLATCAVRDLAVTHAAYAYLAIRTGLTQVAATGVDPDAEPSPSRLRSVAEVLQAAGTTTVFYETGGEDSTATALAELIGAEVAPLDPLETEGAAPGDYIDRQRANLDALRQAQVCS